MCHQKARNKTLFKKGHVHLDSSRTKAVLGKLQKNGMGMQACVIITPIDSQVLNLGVCLIVGKNHLSLTLLSLLYVHLFLLSCRQRALVGGAVLWGGACNGRDPGTQSSFNQMGPRAMCHHGMCENECVPVCFAALSRCADFFSM